MQKVKRWDMTDRACGLYDITRNRDILNNVGLTFDVSMLLIRENMENLENDTKNASIGSGFIAIPSHGRGSLV
jgi:hypothetical protein